ncbi:hypothetical protein PHYBLDRAFT_167104 [Phycomyces blakesleeanus NRRL 1555(-)]|uniref:Uncharacterized protein n=1 Tax=Phycomyces blakesleeanus (strain ATCC 8743b / DSM 1359 / FGSC 10004 / NBRC 33097 / NRRL 1555) TaxID=763407 RepID=A0A162PWD5_PHYB8|nr:hypothetical protein PHYBLDRAFT_167104 [Phycomyces blakesleeanus NRRL 1555(-)]OAD74756.1 hypothetical protein PHYBLDRAFT_167104 [Phycomyces blakesleeanus NRRL 1555(-)]|eukprot:XP_018292796.1 hypothetical protein PHYBLDRAFT_167104 [Phycomyces blakesleeanus NRRL 1555(-)]
MQKYIAKQQTIDTLKKSREISEFIAKKEKKNTVIDEEVNVKLEQMATLKELEQTLQANRYIHKGGNVLPDLESKERTLGFLENLDADGLKEEIKMCKSLFYKCYRNLRILCEFCTFAFW